MHKPTSYHYELLAQLDYLADVDGGDLEATVVGATQRRCLGMDLSAFFPPDGARFYGRALQVERERVARLCSGCPVRHACLAAALRRGEVYGCWGGLPQPDVQVLRQLWRERTQSEAA